MGPKGHERKFASFADAVEALDEMEVPRWRRRNPGWKLGNCNRSSGNDLMKDHGDEA